MPISVDLLQLGGDNVGAVGVVRLCGECLDKVINLSIVDLLS